MAHFDPTFYAFFIAYGSDCAYSVMSLLLKFTFPLAFLIAFPIRPSYGQTLIKTTFRTNAQIVLVPVTVTDHDGKRIDGLRPQDFSVFDDQRMQPIASFTNEDAPCSVGLVLDISGSMRYALATAKNVAQAFVKTANPEDEFLMLTVSSLPDAASAFVNDTETIQQEIQSTTPGGMTALIDTVYLALSRMRGAGQPRHALVIFSDGMDNNSRYSKRDLMRVALEADVQVYSIIVDGLAGTSTSTVPFRPVMAQKPWEQAAARQGPLMLEELSDKTGGLHFHVRKESEAVDAAEKIGRALRNEYVIGYRAPSSVIAANTGKWHRVRVKTTVPKVHVYARDGYYEQ